MDHSHSYRTKTLEHRLLHKRHIIKSIEAEEALNRNLTEKFADFMTNNFGTLGFLLMNAIWFLVWITLNSNVLPFIQPFDPFPHNLLTMVVSLEAIFLAIIVLISQNRAERIANLREEIDLQINSIAEEEITKMIKLQIMILKKHGVDVSEDEELKDMLTPTNTSTIETVIKHQIEEAEKS